MKIVLTEQQYKTLTKGQNNPVDVAEFEMTKTIPQHYIDAIKIFERELDLTGSEAEHLIHRLKHSDDEHLNDLGEELMSFIGKYVDEHINNGNNLF